MGDHLAHLGAVAPVLWVLVWFQGQLAPLLELVSLVGGGLLQGQMPLIDNLNSLLQ